MANSATEICNLALDLLSSDIIQNAVNPSNPTEEVLNRWYDKSRRKVLRTHPWNFAIKRTTLAASSTAPEFGFSAKFRVPADFIRIASMESGDGQPVYKEDYEFESNHILYDSDTLRLRYVYDIQDTTQFDELFTDLLVNEIALGIAFKTTGESSSVQRLMQMRDAIKAEAKAVDGQERPPLRVERSRIMTKRRVTSRRTDIIDG